MIHGYPFTDYHELSLDFIMKLARESLGLHLETSGKFLKLVNANGDDISKLLVTYADMARVDDEGNTISAFILNAGVDGNAVIFTKGNGEVTTITVPYSVKAEKDMNNNAITSYVHDVNVNGDNLIVTFGDGSTLTVTVPYAIKARDDVNGKALTSYVASVVPVGDKLAIKDGNNNTIGEITVPYAVKASNDEDNDNIKTTYGHSLATGTTTVKLLDKSGTMLNEIVVPYSISALEDTDGNAFLSDYGYHLGTNGRKTTIESHTGTTLNEITIPFATLSSDSENAIESVTISGDTIVFTTYSGQNFTITAPYAVKALKDSLNNTFISSYISNVTADNATGKISFFAPDGTKLAEITPTVNKAVNDSFNNRIADYIKTIVTNPNSDYMTVTHGTGETDSITIHYATRAWKDTYDNVIGNTYIKNLEIKLDSTDGKNYLVAYNGEDSELFRISIDDFQAKHNPIIIDVDRVSSPEVVTQVVTVTGSIETVIDTATAIDLFYKGSSVFVRFAPDPTLHTIDTIVIVNGVMYATVHYTTSTPEKGIFNNVTVFNINVNNSTVTSTVYTISNFRITNTIVDNVSGSIPAGYVDVRDVTVTDLPHLDNNEPTIIECCPDRTQIWNNDIIIANARFVSWQTATTGIFRYTLINLTNVTQTLSGGVKLKICG